MDDLKNNKALGWYCNRIIKYKRDITTEKINGND